MSLIAVAPHSSHFRQTTVLSSCCALLLCLTWRLGDFYPIMSSSVFLLNNISEVGVLLKLKLHKGLSWIIFYWHYIDANLFFVFKVQLVVGWVASTIILWSIVIIHISLWKMHSIANQMFFLTCVLFIFSFLDWMARFECMMTPIDGLLKLKPYKKIIGG